MEGGLPRSFASGGPGGRAKNHGRVEVSLHLEGELEGLVRKGRGLESRLCVQSIDRPLEPRDPGAALGRSRKRVHNHHCRHRHFRAGGFLSSAHPQLRRNGDCPGRPGEAGHRGAIARVGKVRHRDCAARRPPPLCQRRPGAHGVRLLLPSVEVRCDFVDSKDQAASERKSATEGRH